MRCFVALWPDDAARARLDALACALHPRWPNARRMRAENLHLTLAFIGELEAAAAHTIAKALPALEFAAFNWRLDRVGSFERARVLWAGGSDEPRLQTLADTVRALLDEQRIRFDRKRFLPHVTLLRDLPRSVHSDEPATIEPPIDWFVDRVMIVQSRADANGARYLPVAVG